MDSMVGQTLFDGRAEVIIVDADSPRERGRDDPALHEGPPQRGLSSHARDHRHLRGLEPRRPDVAGRYLTNANLDNLRRDDSFEIQAGALEAHPWADIVYQDLYYTFDPRLSWEEVAAFGYISSLPVISPYNRW